MRLQSPPAAAGGRTVAIFAVLTLGVIGPVAGPSVAAAEPLALDFSGNGTITDVGAFGVFGASVDVTLWGSSGIAAGPSLAAAGPGGAYNWSFGQVPPTALSNLTIRAWLPWDPNISAALVFDVSNATPRTLFDAVQVPLPFAAVEAITLSSPASRIALPRGRLVTVELIVANTGNVSIAHLGLGISEPSGNITFGLGGGGGNQTEEWPGAVYSANASFLAAPSAALENLTGTVHISSTSGTDFALPLPLRISPNRNAAVLGISTSPLPPDEGRAGEIRVLVGNTGADFAPGTNVQVQALYQTSPTVYLNSSAVDLAPNSNATVSFGWVPEWSPDPVTVQASVSAFDDYDASDDAGTATFSVNSTNLPPGVSFSSPSEGTRVSGNITVSGTAADPEGGAMQVAFDIDEAPPFLNTSGGPFGFQVDLRALQDGPHTIGATAVDSRGLAGASRVRIIVLNRGPNAPPTVALAEPREGDVVGALVSLRGTAGDERGELTGVFVAVDGGPEMQAAGTTAWNLTWDATAAGDGPHQLRVRSFDGIDYSPPAAANVTVNSTAPLSVTLRGLALTPGTAIPSGQIVLSGVASFDTAVLAEGATVSAQVRGFLATFTAAADARGQFTLTLTAPGSAGSYTIDIAAVSGGARGSGTVALVVSTSSLPDLSLLPGGFAVDPDPPPPQTPIHHTIEIANNGSVPANATLRVWDGPRAAANLIYEWRFSIVNSRQAGFDHAYTPGEHILTIALEDVEPQEADPADNTLTVSVPVQDAPDFWVESITPSTSTVRAGVNITFLVSVRNLAAKAGVVHIEVWDGAPLAPNSSLIHQEAVSVLAGERERVLAVWTPTEGEHRIFAKAVLAVPAELILTNNEANISITVSGAAGPSSPVFLPSLGGAGALAAAAAAGALRKRAPARGPPRSTTRGGRAKAAAFACLVGVGLAAAMVPAPGAASFDDTGRVPGPLTNVCQTCHLDAAAGGPLNGFGADYLAERNATGGAVNWTRLGALDSDADGALNGDEWNDSYLPGDPASNPRTGVRYSGFGGAGVTGILTGVVAVVAVSGAGVGLGFYMLKKRNARRAAAASPEQPAREGAGAPEPRAPKP